MTGRAEARGSGGERAGPGARGALTGAAGTRKPFPGPAKTGVLTTGSSGTCGFQRWGLRWQWGQTRDAASY